MNVVTALVIVVLAGLACWVEYRWLHRVLFSSRGGASGLARRPPDLNTDIEKPS